MYASMNLFYALAHHICHTLNIAKKVYRLQFVNEESYATRHSLLAVIVVVPHYCLNRRHCIAFPLMELNRSFNIYCHYLLIILYNFLSPPRGGGGVGCTWIGSLSGNNGHQTGNIEGSFPCRQLLICDYIRTAFCTSYIRGK